MRRLVAAGGRARAVVLTTYDDGESVLAALDAGAIGFLIKDADPDTIAAAIRSAAPAHAGGRAHGPRIRDRPAGGRGLSNQQIAGRLVVSTATVKTHLNHVLAKTGSRDRAALVTFAYTHRTLAP